MAGLMAARYLLADKEYDATALRKRLRQSAFVPVIAGRANRKSIIRITNSATKAANSSKMRSVR
jgi:IS5 family transposase